MNDFQISPEGNSDRIDILEAKLNLILTFTGGQFLAFIGIIITLLIR